MNRRQAFALWDDLVENARFVPLGASVVMSFKTAAKFDRRQERHNQRHFVYIEKGYMLASEAIKTYILIADRHGCEFRFDKNRGLLFYKKGDVQPGEDPLSEGN